MQRIRGKAVGLFRISLLEPEHCEKAYDSGGVSSEGTPVLEALRHVAAALADGMSEALQASELSSEQLELQSAVAALLRNPALIERWRSGRKLGLRSAR